MAMDEPRKRVAIIGAGISGLVSLKECLAEGIEADVFENRSEIGGQWAYQAVSKDSDEPQSSMYDGVIMNSCRDTTGFSDFPLDPARHGDYFGHRQMLQYVHEYADHFGLRKHISLSTKVLDCTQDDKARWIVRFQRPGSAPEEQAYDALIAAPGVNSIPLKTDFRSQELFTGEFLHSHRYRSPGPYEGKRVVLIGVGSAAVDIASELAPASKEVHVITRRGAWIFPRFVLGKPLEAWDNRATQNLLPQSIAESIQTWLLNTVQGKHPKELQPEHSLMSQNATVRSDFLEKINAGTIKIHRAEVEGFTAAGIRLSDGTEIEADVVIACTGYQRTLPYLPADVLRTTDTPENQLDLYKLIVPARYSNLYLVGYIEAAGPSPPAVEAQARFAVGAISGIVKLPTGDALLKKIRDWQQWHAKEFINSARHTNTEHYVPYIDSLMEPLGAKPTFLKLFRRVFTSGSPLKAWSTLLGVYFDIASSAHWRLTGHGNKEELAQETILRIHKGKLQLSEKEVEFLKS